MKRFTLFSAIATLVLNLALPAMAQEPTPTPTPVPFQQGCTDTVIDDRTLFSNGGFGGGDPILGMPPIGWSGSGDLMREEISEDVFNYYVELKDGASVSQTPKKESVYTFFDLSFCYYLPPGGELVISFGSNYTTSFPLDPSLNTEGRNGIFKKLNFSGIDLGTDSSVRENTLIITYYGGGEAIIDNIQLVGNTTGGGEDGTPTPEPEEPTATPTPDDGPTPTPTPPLMPGMITPTPTPHLMATSVQVIANPPALVVSPDDFASRDGFKKVINLDFQVIGSDGQPMDIVAIDDKAMIRINVETRGDAKFSGQLSEFKVGSNSWTTLHNSRVKLADLGRIQFFPTKPYNGTVKLIVEIQYKSDAYGRLEQREIRGVIPIVIRTDSAASLTHASGTFNPTQNFRQNRKPGDRGFRPDWRTNLYFRELIEK